MLLGVVQDSGQDDGIRGEGGFGEATLLELVAREAGAELMDRSAGGPTDATPAEPQPRAAEQQERSGQPEPGEEVHPPQVMEPRSGRERPVSYG